MHGADLLARSPEPFAARLLGALHQTTRGDEILYARKAGDILNLIQNDQRENLPDPWHRLEASKGLHVVGFGTARNVEFDFPQELVIVIDEGDIDFNGLPYAGIGEVLFHSLAIRLVRQLLPNLGQIVLTIGIVNVG